MRAAVRSDEPPRYHREATGSRVDTFEPEIRRLLQADPKMPATVIAERIDWPGGMTVLKERVRELRPLFVPVDPSQRTVYAPGQLGQWNLWFPAVDIPLGYGQTCRLPVIVGVSGYSRVIVGRMIGSRETHDVLGGHLACLVDLGGVPREGVYDSNRRSAGVAVTVRSSPRRSRRSAARWRWVPTSAGLGTRRPRGWWAGEPLPADQLPARAGVRVGRGLQRPAGRVAGEGQPAGAPGAALPSG